MGHVFKITNKTVFRNLSNIYDGALLWKYLIIRLQCLNMNAAYNKDLKVHQLYEKVYPYSQLHKKNFLQVAMKLVKLIKETENQHEINSEIAKSKNVYVIMFML